MQPDRGRGGGERIHTLGQQARDHAGEHVAGAAGREIGRRIGVDDGAPVGRRDHGVGALEHDHRAARGGGGAGARELVALEREQPRELALVRRQHGRPRDRAQERRGLIGKDGQGIGIEHDGAPRRERRQHHLAERQVVPPPGPSSTTFRRASPSSVLKSSMPPMPRTITLVSALA